MKRISIFSLGFLFLAFFAQATTFQVGPQRMYTFPSQVMNLVQNGDTVDIDAGVYLGDVGVWTANDLLIRGIGGKAHLRANGNNAQGKAIWVIQGDDNVLEHIEFSEASVPDQNGAGIRMEGTNLTLRHCYFHDNEQGILAGDNPESRILVEFSEFANNGFGNGFTHHIYANRIFRLTVQFCYLHHANVGHHIKSRARYSNILYNRIMDEEDGNSSYLIDLPDGGIATVMGNLLMQGPFAENGSLISYGFENYPFEYMHRLFVYNNSMVNGRSAGNFVSINGFPMGAVLNNIMVGPGNVLGDTGGVELSTNLVIGNLAEANFEDAQNYNYQINSSSEAINAAVHPGSFGASTWFPELEYVHPMDSISRPVDGPLDIGAYEFPTTTSTSESSFELAQVQLFPNPVRDELTVDLSTVGSTLKIGQYQIYAADGRSMNQGRAEFAENTLQLDLSTFYSGLYYLILSDENGQIVAQQSFEKF